MSLKIRDYLLTGPFEPEKSSVRANQDPVVYVVVEKHGQPWDPKFRFIAAGDSGDTGLRFADHPELAAWRSGATAPISLYFHACSRAAGVTDKDRARIVAEINAAMREASNQISIQGGI